MARGTTTAKSADAAAKKRVKVSLSGGRDMGNAVDMTVEANGRVCIIDERGQCIAQFYPFSMQGQLLT